MERAKCWPDGCRKSPKGSSKSGCLPVARSYRRSRLLDAVQQNTVEICHTASYYFHGKNKAFALDCSVPFGLTRPADVRLELSWRRRSSAARVFAKYNVVNFLGGNTGTQMGGWFRKEINSLEDLKGLQDPDSRFRREVFSALGAVPQSLPGGEAHPRWSSATTPPMGRPLRRRKARLLQGR